MRDSVNKKFAYKSDYLFFGDKFVKDKYLLVNGALIEGIADKADGYDVVEFKDSFIMPSFANSHSHSAMVFLRGYSCSRNLQKWLFEDIVKMEEKFVLKDGHKLIEASLYLASIEMIRSGVSFVADMYFFPHLTAKIFSNVGLNVATGSTLLPSDTEEMFNLKMDKLAEEGVFENIFPSIILHSVYTSSGGELKRLKKIIDKCNYPILTHTGEAKYEIEKSKFIYGKTPINVLNDYGLLKNGGILAHCVHVDEDEMNIICSNNKLSVAHCPDSNLFLSNGVAPIYEMFKRGTHIGIGTDGAASNHGLDLVDEVATAFKLQGLGDNSLSIDKIIQFATSGSYNVFNIKSGVLQEGYNADFIVVSTKNAHMRPLHNIFSNFVLSGNKSDITDLYVKGECIMRNGKILKLDEEECIRNFDEIINSLNIVKV